MKNTVRKQSKNSTMTEDIMNFDLPVERSSIIKVIGIGGRQQCCKSHVRKGIKDVNFVVCNTDHQVSAALYR
jgi:cell division GTPase FtsZ